MLRAIREISPRYVVGENVPGFTNWNGGMVFDQVQADLEAEGYEVLPFLLPACAVNAPHRRDRIWIIAHSKKAGSSGLSERTEQAHSIHGGNGQSGTTAHAMRDGRSGEHEVNSNKGRVDALNDLSQNEGEGPAPDTGGIGQQGPGRTERPGNSETIRNWKASWSYDDGRWPTQPPVCSRNDGLPAGLSGITISKHRKESIMAYGNAIVPAVALEIFKAIQLVDNGNAMR